MERKEKYDLAFKLNCVKLVDEKSYSTSTVSQKYGINQSQLDRWLQNYRRLGLNGLISAQNRSYTTEFKLKVIQEIKRESLSLRDAKFKFKIPNESVIVQWQKKFATFGLDGLKSNPKGRPVQDMSIYKRKARKSNKPLTREEELLIENEKLRCEVAFLKKYNALVQAQQEAERQRKSKPSKN